MPKMYPQSPLLVALDGDGMTADDAAWAAIAAAVEAQLTLPGLSEPCAERLREASDSCRHAAGLAPRQWLRENVA